MLRIGLAVVLTIGVLAATLAAEAQQAPRTFRIGFLGTTLRQDETAFRQGLLDLGYVEGKNFRIEYRWADDQYERLPALAAELVRSGVDVIVVYGTPGSLAAQKATTTIPIVMVAGDPVRSGLVASLPRPGGNITGLSIQDFELIIKRLELLKEVVSTASRVAYLQVPGIQPPDVAESLQRQEDSAARSMGLQLQRVRVRGLSDFAGAFSTMAKNGAQALTVANVAPLGTHAAEIAALATQYRLPAIGGQKGMARTGLLLTYGPDLSDLQRRSAIYVDISKHVGRVKSERVLA